MSVSARLATHALGFSFDGLTDKEVHAAKRVLLDMLACAVGAYESETGRIVRGLVREQGGAPEATVIGSGARVPAPNAALANGAMVRYLDYNDTYFRSAGKLRLGIHPNELIPSVLAVGEREGASGKDVIAAIALAYDLAERFVDASVGQPLESIGWHYSVLAGYIVALCAGRLLGLDDAQLVNALGIAGVHSATLGIIDAAGETYNMTKNVGLPWVAHTGITAALLAQKGFTGPARIIEGNKGLVKTLMLGRYDLETLFAPRGRPALLEIDQKNLVAEHTTQGALNGILEIVKAHDLKAEQVKSVRIRTGSRTAEHTGDYAKRYPEDKETADHSLYYLASVAIIDRAVGPGQYRPEKYADPLVRSLIDRVTVEASPELDELIFVGVVDIETTDGRKLHTRVDYPKGNSLNPMADDDLLDKFRGVALPVLGRDLTERVADRVFALDRLAGIGELMGMVKAE